MQDDERLKNFVSGEALQHLRDFILEGLALTPEEKKALAKHQKVQKTKKKLEQKEVNKSLKRSESLKLKIYKELDIEVNGLNSFWKMYIFEDLTEKEALIVELLKQGYSYVECAEKLFISVSTIKTHIANVFQKRGVSSLQELLVLELTGQVKGSVVQKKKQENNYNNVLNLLNNLL